MSIPPVHRPVSRWPGLSGLPEGRAVRSWWGRECYSRNLLWPILWWEATRLLMNVWAISLPGESHEMELSDTSLFLTYGNWNGRKKHTHTHQHPCSEVAAGSSVQWCSGKEKEHVWFIFTLNGVVTWRAKVSSFIYFIFLYIFKSLFLYFVS